MQCSAFISRPDETRIDIGGGLESRTGWIAFVVVSLCSSGWVEGRQDSGDIKNAPGYYSHSCTKKNSEFNVICISFQSTVMYKNRP